MKNKRRKAKSPIKIADEERGTTLKAFATCLREDPVCKVAMQKCLTCTNAEIDADSLKRVSS